MQHNFQVGLARAMPSALAVLLVLAAAQAADADAPSVDVSSPEVQSEITRKYNRQIADGENRKLLQEIIDGAPNTTFVRNQPGYAYKHMPILEFAADAATSDVVASVRVLGADPDSSQPQDEDDYVLAVWIQRFEPTSVNETVDVNTSAAARSGWGVDEQIVYLQPLAGKDSSGKGVKVRYSTVTVKLAEQKDGLFEGGTGLFTPYQLSRLSGLWEGPTTPLEGAEFEVVRDDEPVKDEV